MKQRIKYIHDMVQRGGPNEEEYDELDAWFRAAMADYRSGAITEEQIKTIWDAFGVAGSRDTMQGFVFLKPHGYHGDWEIIDRMYTRWISTDPKLRKWDIYFHSRHAPKAVRNRIACLRTRLNALVSTRETGPIEVLVVGCGPARDISDYLEHHPDTRVHFTCLDQDETAIQHARSLCAKWPASVDFRLANVIRHLPKKTFDLVWAAGLFDYFNDQLFVLMTRRLRHCMKPDGLLTIGNFSTHNPTRAYMEFGGWSLILRSEEELIALATKAGIPAEEIHITTESEGVQLFLDIRKNA